LGGRVSLDSEPGEGQSSNSSCRESLLRRLPPSSASDLSAVKADIAPNARLGFVERKHSITAHYANPNLDSVGWRETRTVQSSRSGKLEC
jgi:hypothetical protein